MRNGLPLWYCLSLETQEKLRPMMTELFGIPQAEWKEWQKPETQRYREDYFKYKEIHREMSKPPSRSRG